MNTRLQQLRFIVILFFFCFLLSGSSFSQAFLKTLWDKDYNADANDRTYASIRADDGSFLLVGETSATSSPESKILVLKISKTGDLIWRKTFGTGGDFKFHSVAKSKNEGFYLLAIKQEGQSKKFIWLSKADANGNLLWENATPAGELDNITDLTETSDNSLFVCGSKEIKGDHDTDAWLIRYNKKGTIESQSLFGNRYINDEFIAVSADNSGGYILTGFTSAKMGDEKIPYFVNVDYRGNKKWEKSFPEFVRTIPASAYINSSGNLAVLSQVYSGSGSFEKIMLLVISQSGEKVSNFSVNRDLAVSKFSYIQLENDQLLMLSSKQDQTKILSDKYLIRLDNSLVPLWIMPLDIENIFIESLYKTDNATFLSSGIIKTGSRQSSIARLIQDNSDSEVEKYVSQKLLSVGMTAVEDRNSFRTRIGRAKFDGYIAQYSAEAVKSLSMIPETYTRDVSATSDSRPSIIISDKKEGGAQIDPLLKGQYYALLIAINDYKDPLINNLDKPISDAQKLFDVLVNEYLFEKTNITFLKNPTREQIISAFDRLEKDLTKADNLLIFYAGHGYWNDVTQKGYWLASDASKQNTANWIGNSSISDYIRSIPAKHTLLIADACFSGSIFKTRAAFGGLDKSAQKLYDLTSRKAMTSGTLTEVPDKSVFVEYLLKRLSDNPENYLSSEQLFFSFKPAVLNNTENIPQFGVVGNAGDEGGDFIFIRRKK